MKKYRVFPWRNEGVKYLFSPPQQQTRDLNNQMLSSWTLNHERTRQKDRDNGYPISRRKGGSLPMAVWSVSNGGDSTEALTGQIYGRTRLCFLLPRFLNSGWFSAFFQGFCELPKSFQILFNVMLAKVDFCCLQPKILTEMLSFFL